MVPERPAQAHVNRRDRVPAGTRDRLRRLAEPTAATDTPPPGVPGEVGRHGLDERSAALVRLGALVALRAGPASYRGAVDHALDAGASVDDVVATLSVVARAVGLARVVSAAPDLALSLGYDIDRALETLDGRPARRPTTET